MKKRFLIARARLNEGVVLDGMTKVLSVLLKLFSLSGCSRICEKYPGGAGAIVAHPQ